MLTYHSLIIFVLLLFVIDVVVGLSWTVAFVVIVLSVWVFCVLSLIVVLLLSLLFHVDSVGAVSRWSVFQLRLEICIGEVIIYFLDRFLAYFSIATKYQE